MSTTTEEDQEIVSGLAGDLIAEVRKRGRCPCNTCSLYDAFGVIMSTVSAYKDGLQADDVQAVLLKIAEHTIRAIPEDEREQRRHEMSTAILDGASEDLGNDNLSMSTVPRDKEKMI